MAAMGWPCELVMHGGCIPRENIVVLAAYVCFPRLAEMSSPHNPSSIKHEVVRVLPSSRRERTVSTMPFISAMGFKTLRHHR